MPETFKSYSREIIGYIVPKTPVNARYITAVKVQKLLDKGKTPEKIFLAWNAGESATKCSKGVNKHGVPYNSCGYVATATKYLNQ